jgi:hypothetical protein
MPDRKEVSLERARELVRILEAQLPDRMPAPPNTELGERFDQRLMEGQGRRDGRDIHMFPVHLRTWFDTLSVDDVQKLERLMAVKAETVAWIDAKNGRELQKLDGAVEFITSSRTAAKVLIWIGGMAVAFVGGVAALAKNGIDLFSMLRGGR